MLAIQLVNYRTRSFLERCLATVVPDLECSGIDYEVNLLDNDSGESLDELARGIRFARSFDSPTNVGFGAGHNLLAGKTSAPYLLILNPDVEFLNPGTAERLLATLESSDRVAAVGPKLLRADGSAQAYDHGRLHGLRAQIALRGGHSYWRETALSQNVAWVSGAALLVDHAAFDRIGGFDANLFLYKEDEDLCLRLRGAGWDVRYDPTITVRHHGSVVADRSDELLAACDYFFAKHFRRRRLQQAFAAAHQSLAYLRL
jgi:N-acetylglucosaminyl-diphospho-decaprenol L-rhamnosyltransferase